jgi:hypothetical protein
LRAIYVAVVFGLAAITAGCASSASNEEQTQRSDGALGLATPVPSGERRVIRKKLRECGPIAGVGGSWIGAPLNGAIGTSSAFCTYEWTTVGRNTAPDMASLEGAALTDPQRDQPYVVVDGRAGNTPVPGTTLLAPEISFAPTPPPPPQAVFAPGLTFTLGGAPTATLAAGFTTPPIGGGAMPICEVCVELDIEHENLWVVLPPDAMDAETIVIETDDYVYEVGPTVVPIFYVPAPALYSSYYHVKWY